MEVLFRAKKRVEQVQAATKRLEEKLKIQMLFKNKSDNVLRKKKQLGNLTFKVAVTQSE
jgi:hypothetical protein